MREIDTNKVKLTGKLLGRFTFSHEVFGEMFYQINMEVKRLSDNADIIPLTVSERIIDVSADCNGRKAKVSGQFRSYDKHKDDRARLILSVFVQEIVLADELVDPSKTNQIFLDGYICKVPIYRKTSLGREIADILLAVNRPYGKSDYIPCIAWGRNARCAAGFEVGARACIWGRVQSRKYQKRIPETETETRTAIEVSISRLELVQ